MNVSMCLSEKILIVKQLSFGYLTQVARMTRAFFISHDPKSGNKIV